MRTRRSLSSISVIQSSRRSTRRTTSSSISPTPSLGPYEQVFAPYRSRATGTRLLSSTLLCLGFLAGCGDEDAPEKPKRTMADCMVGQLENVLEEIDFYLERGNVEEAQNSAFNGRDYAARQCGEGMP